MDKSQRTALWQALNIAWELGYTIAIPLVILALVGRWADAHLHTHPWLFLVGIVLAIISSSIILVRKFSKLLRQIPGTPTK
jgi:ATP synthase protein I